MMDEGGGVREEGSGMRGERLSVKEEGRGSGSELGSDLDLDPGKLVWIRIRNTALLGSCWGDIERIAGNY